METQEMKVGTQELTETKTVITGLQEEVARKQGRFDSASRWEFTDERVGKGTRCDLCGVSLRVPSRGYPYSVLKHAYTRKHALACLKAGIVQEEDLQKEERRVKKPNTDGLDVVKVVRERNGRYFSLYDSITEYRIGEPMRETVKPDHAGGYYAFPFAGLAGDGDPIITPSNERLSDLFRQQRVLSYLFGIPHGDYAILLCRGEGRRIAYPARANYVNKLAFSKLTPLRVLKTFSYG